MPFQLMLLFSLVMAMEVVVEVAAVVVVEGAVVVVVEGVVCVLLRVLLLRSFLLGSSSMLRRVT